MVEVPTVKEPTKIRFLAKERLTGWVYRFFFYHLLIFEEFLSKRHRDFEREGAILKLD